MDTPAVSHSNLPASPVSDAFKNANLSTSFQRLYVEQFWKWAQNVSKDPDPSKVRGLIRWRLWLAMFTTSSSELSSSGKAEMGLPRQWGAEGVRLSLSSRSEDPGRLCLRPCPPLATRPHRLPSVCLRLPLLSRVSLTGLRLRSLSLSRR